MSCRGVARGARSKSSNGRRVFRGRGGPTDGNLPRFPSKKPPRSSDKQATELLKTAGGADDQQSSEELEPVLTVPQYQSQQEDIIDTQAQKLDDSLIPQSFDGASRKDVNHEYDGEEGVGDLDSQAKLEVLHVRERMRVVEELIRLSQGLANPAKWEENCLNAAKKCTNEWRSILSYHGSCPCLEPKDELSRETAVQVFMLIQIALQSGPLAGSKPGYFKRCGADVAMKALSFLHSLSEDLVVDYRFTEKQSDAVKKWLSAATKAVAEGKPPSKSATKLQHQRSKKQHIKDRKKSQKAG